MSDYDVYISYSRRDDEAQFVSKMMPFPPTTTPFPVILPAWTPTGTITAP